MWVYNSYGYSNELYHHGIKGMKWGVRNEKESSGTTRFKNTMADLGVAGGLMGMHYKKQGYGTKSTTKTSAKRSATTTSKINKASNSKLVRKIGTKMASPIVNRARNSRARIEKSGGKANAILSDVAKGAAKDLGLWAGSKAVSALSAAMVASGHTKAGVILGTAGTATMSVARLANSISTGTKVVDDLVYKTKK